MEYLEQMKTSVPVTTILLIIVITVQQLWGAGSHTPGEFKRLYGPTLNQLMGCICTPISLPAIELSKIAIYIQLSILCHCMRQ